MPSAQCQEERERAIGSLIVALDSEVTKTGDEGVRLRRSDTSLAFRHRQDIRNLDEPQGGHKCRLGCQSVQQRGRLRRGFVIEQPSHGNGTINDEHRTHRRPSTIRSLIFNPASDKPVLSFRIRLMAAARCSKVASFFTGTSLATGAPCLVIIISSPPSTFSSSSDKCVFAS